MQNKSSFEEQLDKNGVLVFTNKGVSMMPLLRQDRDIMIIEKRSPERLKKYDAVLFKRSNNQYVLHRILKVRPQDYWIVGDNCIKGEYVTDSQILGVLTAVIRDKKKIECNNILYKCYVHLWCDFYPLRVALIKAKYKLRGIYHKIQK